MKRIVLILIVVFGLLFTGCTSLIELSKTIELQWHFQQKNATAETVNKKYDTGETPLVYEISRYQRLDIIKKLVDLGADVNEKFIYSGREYSILSLIVAYKPDEDTVDIVKYLVGEGADVSYVTSDGFTLLDRLIMVAMFVEDFDELTKSIFELLIDSGADLDAHYVYDLTVLTNFAGISDNVEIIKYLIEQNDKHEINVNWEDVKAALDHNFMLKDEKKTDNYKELYADVERRSKE